MSETALPSDPAIEEVRNARHRISERVDHDPARLVRYYMELQEKFRERLISGPPLPPLGGRSAA